MLQNHLRKNRLRKHYLNAQNPGASLGPQPGLCPGPTGDLKRSQDPLPNFVPLTSNPGSAPVSVCPSVRLLFYVTLENRYSGGASIAGYGLQT